MPAIIVGKYGSGKGGVEQHNSRAERRVNDDNPSDDSDRHARRVKLFRSAAGNG